MKKVCLLFVCLFSVISCNQNPTDGSPTSYYKYIKENNIPSNSFPTLYINTNSNNDVITRENYIDAVLSLTNSNGEFLYTVEDITVKGRGNASWTSTDKKGYNIKFSKKKEILEMNKAKKWNIISNYFDKSLLRNWTANYIANNILTNVGWNPTCEFIDLFLNGEYRGNYIISECIEIAESKINIQDISKIDDIKNGGFVLEIDFRNDADYYFESKFCKLPFTLKDPDLDKIENDKAELIVQCEKDIIDTIEEKLCSSDFEKMQLSEIDFIDTDSFIDWYLLEEFAKNLDGDFYTSVYMYYNPDDKKVYMGPHWDFDHSFGNYIRSVTYDNGYKKNCSTYDGLWISTTQNQGKISWYELLLKNEEFKKVVSQRWNEISSSLDVLICESKDSNVIYQKAKSIQQSAEKNFLTWDILGKDIACDVFGYQERMTYMSEVEYLINWMRLRKTWLDDYYKSL